MSKGIALYYPHTQFRNVEWLKWALLFWDGGIRRIIPADMKPADSDDVRAAHDAGAIINTDTAPYRTRVAAQFIEHIAEYESVDFPSEGHSYIAYDKMSEELIHDLVARELAFIPTRRQLPNDYLIWYDSDEPFVALPERLAVAYMTLLAKEISEATGAPVITDRPRYASVGQQILSRSDDHRPLDERTSTVLQELLVDFVSEKSVRETPLKSILTLRDKRVDEMRRFREEIEGTVAILSNCTDPNQYNDAVSDAKKKLSTAVNEQRRLLKDYDLEFRQQVLTVASPSVLIGLAGTLTDHVLVPFLAGMVTLGGAIKLASSRYDLKVESLAGSAKYQYLLTLTSELDY